VNGSTLGQLQTSPRPVGHQNKGQEFSSLPTPILNGFISEKLRKKIAGNSKLFGFVENGCSNRSVGLNEKEVLMLPKTEPEPEAFVACFKCGQTFENEKSVPKHCPGCDSKLRFFWICPKCSFSDQPKGAKFCVYCSGREKLEPMISIEVNTEEILRGLSGDLNDILPFFSPAIQKRFRN